MSRDRKEQLEQMCAESPERGMVWKEVRVSECWVLFPQLALSAAFSPEENGWWTWWTATAPPPPHPAASVYDLFDYGLWVTVAPGQQLWNVLGTELP